MNDIFVLPLTNSSIICLIDEEDRERVLRYSWHLNKNGYICCNSHIGTLRSLARFVLNCQEKLDVDHINGRLFDNRKVELRKCQHKQNKWNVPTRKYKNKQATSKFRGVSWAKHMKKWKVAIRNGVNKIELGYFESEVDAAKAYNVAAVKYHKDFAHLNILP